MKKLLLVFGILVAACGSPAQVNPAVPSDGSAPAPAGSASVLPDVEVSDVATGEVVNLASLAPAPRPQLLWMWAPH